MEKKEKEHITKSLPKLLEATHCNDYVVTSLSARKLLNPGDEDKLESEREKQKKNKILYNTLLTRVGAYKALMEILIENNQSEPYMILAQLYPTLGSASSSTPSFTSGEIVDVLEQSKSTGIILQNFFQWATRLGVPNGKVNTLKMQHTMGAKSIYEMYSEVFEYWLADQSDKADLEALTNVFIKCGMRGPADELQKHFSG